jgi:site-specific recombinase XerD
VRISVDKRRIFLSLKRKVEISKWDQSNFRLKGYSKVTQQINNYLDQTYRDLLEAHAQLISENKVITADAIKLRYLGEDDSSMKLSDLLEFHRVHMQTTLKPGTLKNYRTTEKYLNQFLSDKLKTSDIYLKEISYRFITDFEYYLRTYNSKSGRPAPSNNGVMKHLERLKKLTNLAQKLEWIEKDPFAKYSLKFTRFEREYLTTEELENLMSHEFNRTSLQKVRDIFVFACYTGLAWIDVKNLTTDNIVRGIDGGFWINTAREKTDTMVKIPLLSVPQQIIHQYAELSMNTPYLLPVCSNQKTNQYLKEIAETLGIQKRLTFHVARHTFATTVTLANGVPIETVSKLLGHTKIATTQIYARVLDRKISEDMNMLRKALADKQDNRSERSGTL